MSGYRGWITERIENQEDGKGAEWKKGGGDLRDNQSFSLYLSHLISSSSSSSSCSLQSSLPSKIHLPHCFLALHPRSQTNPRTPPPPPPPHRHRNTSQSQAKLVHFTRYVPVEMSWPQTSWSKSLLRAGEGGGGRGGGGERSRARLVALS